MEPGESRHGSRQFSRVPRLNSGTTCGVCSGLGGQSQRAYVEHYIRFVQTNVALCPNCGVRYEWSHASVTVQRGF